MDYFTHLWNLWTGLLEQGLKTKYLMKFSERYCFLETMKLPSYLPMMGLFLTITETMMMLKTNLIPCQPRSHSPRVELIREIVSEPCKRSCNLVRSIMIIIIIIIIMIMVVIVIMQMMITDWFPLSCLHWTLSRQSNPTYAWEEGRAYVIHL